MRRRWLGILLLAGSTAAALPPAGTAPDDPPHDATGAAVMRDAHAVEDAVEDARGVLHGVLPGSPGAARSTLEALAAAGHAAAASALAEADYLGLGAPRDPASAIDWWTRAAARGDTRAAFNAGLLLLRTPHEAERARPLLAQAAASGDALAAFALGTDRAAHGDTRTALALLEQAARSGYAPAQYNLARLREADDPVAAARWYRRAAPDFAPAEDALARLESATGRAGLADTAEAGRAWLLAQPPSAYTIQVSAGPDPQALARLLAAHAGALPSAWFAHRRDGGDPYIAVVGSFADAAAAEAALAALPEALTRHRPWVRRIAGLQSALDAAAPP